MSDTLFAGRPLREALTELTFEAEDEGLDPFGAYVRLSEKLGRLGVTAEAYCSSSITSGGHARDSSLEIGQVITRNTDTALSIGDELFEVGQLNPKTTIEAVTLGKLPWKQSDYMTFWLSTMAGLQSHGHGVHVAMQDFRRDFEAAQRRDEELDMDIYDSRQSTEIRAPHYFNHANLFAATAQQHDARPVDKLVRLVDPDTSLGAQTENLFARIMGARVFRVAVAETGVEPSAQSLPPHLVSDTQHLVQFGATVFDTLRRQQLILVPQDA